MHSSELENTLFWSSLLQIWILSMQERLHRSPKTISSAFGFYITITLFDAMSLLSAHTSEDKLFGDWGHFIDMRFHMNMLLFFTTEMGHISLIIQYYEYIHRRGQPYMNVFYMMSGQITPHSIGLNNENKIKNILKKTRICFKLIKLFLFSAPITAFIISTLSYLDLFQFLAPFQYFNFIISNQKVFTNNNTFWFNSFTNIFVDSILLV